MTPARDSGGTDVTYAAVTHSTAAYVSRAMLVRCRMWT